MKIAFIGLGNMGGGMAANLAKAGHEVRATVRDASRRSPTLISERPQQPTPPPSTGRARPATRPRPDTVAAPPSSGRATAKPIDSSTPIAATPIRGSL